jgi:protein TonB
VLVRVLIGVDGTAQRPKSNSPAATTAWTRRPWPPCMRWRYVPGKRGGVAEAMWFNVPINFVLE